MEASLLQLRQIDSNKAFIGALVLVSLFLLVPKLGLENAPRVNYVNILVIAVVAFIGFIMSKNITLSLVIAIIVSTIVILLMENFNYNSNYQETFEDEPADKTEEDADAPTDDTELVDKPDVTSAKSMIKPTKPTKPTTKPVKSTKPILPVKKMDDEDNDAEYKLDTKASMLDNYKNLSKDDLKSLNSDTRELIETQRQLMETITNMGPALSQGKTVLDTFRTYFGDADLKTIESKM